MDRDRAKLLIIFKRGLLVIAVAPLAVVFGLALVHAI
jgi:uncharacterized membrane protein